MFDGILLVKKPKGLTSYDVIRRLKPQLERKNKIGHAGSLDPFATGLLIITLGKGTKLFDRFQELRKVYRVVGEFGYETDTYDNTGEKTSEDSDYEVKVSFDGIEAILKEKFTGEILQKPPKYSAKKIGGKRAYDLARENKDFEIEPKKVNVYKIDLIKCEPPFFELYVECSKGTYIRSLIVDVARELGTFATPCVLERVAIGELSLENAKDLDKIDVVRDVIKIEDLKI